jgi:hypothetical protein
MENLGLYNLGFERIGTVAKFKYDKSLPVVGKMNPTYH